MLTISNLTPSYKLIDKTWTRIQVHGGRSQESATGFIKCGAAVSVIILGGTIFQTTKHEYDQNNDHHEYQSRGSSYDDNENGF